MTLIKIFLCNDQFIIYYQTNFGIFSIMNKLLKPAVAAKTALIMVGIGPLNTTIWGARIVVSLAATLLYPKIDALYKVGVKFIAATNTMLKHADIPNLAMNTNMGIKLTLLAATTKTRMTEPMVEIVNMPKKLFRGPSFIKTNPLRISAITSAAYEEKVLVIM